MKKILFFMLLGLFLVSCDNNKTQENDNNQNTIKVGTATGYPPFEFKDDQDNISGFDIDLIKAVGQKLNLNIEIVDMSFDSLITALKSGKIDIIAAAMSATDDRKESVDFTNSYYNTKNLFITKKDSNLTTKDDLEGKKIGASLGTVQEAAANEIKDAEVVIGENTDSIITQLKSDKIDVAVTDYEIGKNYLEKNDDLKEMLVEQDNSEGFSFALDKDKNPDLVEKINKAIDELKADGTFDILLEKYNLTK